MPARAVTVYALAVLFAVTLVLGALAYLSLLHRTAAVCGPLRYGQHAGEKYQGRSPIARDFTRTFGRSADKLGCSQNADR